MKLNSAELDKAESAKKREVAKKGGFCSSQRRLKYPCESWETAFYQHRRNKSSHLFDRPAAAQQDKCSTCGCSVKKLITLHAENVWPRKKVTCFELSEEKTYKAHMESPRP